MPKHMHMVYSRLNTTHPFIVRAYRSSHIPPIGCIFSRLTGESLGVPPAAAAAAAATAAALMLRALVCSSKLAARVTSGDVDSGRGMFLWLFVLPLLLDWKG